MKTLIAALAVTVGILAAALPASADYSAPGGNRLLQSTTHGY